MIGSFPFLSFMLEAVLLGSAALGLLLAPSAGLVTGLSARSKGLSAWKYGAVGAFYCALTILPWLYLAARMVGRKPNAFCVMSGYGFLYGLWLFGQICTFGVLNAATNFSRRVSGSSTGTDEPYTILLLVTLALLVVSIIHILVYRSASFRRSARHETFLIPVAYLMPFIYVWAGHLLLIVYVIEIDV